mmetsp:Transcript_79510/g.227020  ORF Transcript_79510/g.227020 Transcript_79510/m.227020 type:complete len:91 (-) Transcript_79510:730-1002(-)
MASVHDIDGLPAMGTAVLSAETGSIIKSSGDLQGAEGEQAAAALYQVLLDTGAILKDEPLRRISVSYSSHQYIISLSGGAVYIVKSKAAS